MTNPNKSQSPLLVVGAVIYSTDKKIMLCQRSAGDSGAGLWEFPGGKVEVGESKKQALQREIQEELGVDCLIEEFIDEKDYSYPSITIRLSLFFVRLKSDNIKLTDHQAYLWVDAKSITGYQLTAADQPFVGDIFTKLANKY